MSWTTVIFKCCGKHGIPPPYLSCPLPSFYISLMGGTGFYHPSPLPYLLIDNKTLLNPPPLSPPTSVLVPISLYFPSFTLWHVLSHPNPTQPRSPRNTFSLPDHWDDHLAKASGWKTQKNIVWSNDNFLYLVFDRSIYVEAVMGITMGLYHFSKLV